MGPALRRCAVLAGLLLLSGCNSNQGPAVTAVLETYRAVAQAAYAQALADAIALERATAQLAAAPGDASLAQARQAWIAAHESYSRTEALRFGNWFVDEWETRVNAWPVDEGFIDYVAPGSADSPGNPYAWANLIASESIDIGGRRLSLSPLGPLNLDDAQNLGDFEANVATGYHAIEFLLWGQDLNGHGPGAGARPWTDFSLDARSCSDGARAAPLRHCRRRHDYLAAALSLLRLDLQRMSAIWGARTGSYGDRLVHGDPQEGLRRVLFGLASMAGQEMAGERIGVALLSHAPEEEQDCFSDQTHRSLWANALGIEQLYYGRLDGAAQVLGPGVAALARSADPDLAARLDAAFADTRERLARIRQAGLEGRRFDQLIAEDNEAGARMLAGAVEALGEQARLLERLGEVLGLQTLNPQAPRAAT